jgi:hypothetical protein
MMQEITYAKHRKAVWRQLASARCVGAARRIAQQVADRCIHHGGIMHIGHGTVIPAMLALSAAGSILLLVAKARKRRLAAPPPKADRPGQADGKEELLTSKTLLLLIVVGYIVWLYFSSPRSGAAVVAGIIVLPILGKLVRLARAEAPRESRRAVISAHGRAARIRGRCRFSS